MDKLIIGLIEVSVALTIFYGYYLIFLKKQSFFTANRLYLLGSAFISVFLPLFQFNLPEAGNQQVTLYNVIDTITISANAIEQNLVSKILAISVFQWILVVYLAGMLIRFIIFIVQLLQIAALTKSALTLGVNVVEINKPIVPFSFMNRIYINPGHYSEQEFNEIVAHEKIHVQQKHTLDCLFYEILIILFWFHPVAYRYRNEAKEVHEFLADQGAIRSGIDHIAYQQLLFAQTMAVNTLQLPNSFNYSLLKRRLIMLTNNKTSKWMKARFIWLAPLAIAVFIVFACNKTDKTEQTIIQIAGENLTEENQAESNAIETDTTIYFIVETMPVFPGGDEALRKHIFQNIKYPEKAKETMTEGKVYVQFVVNSFGKIEQIKTAAIRVPVYSKDSLGNRIIKEYTEVFNRNEKSYDELEIEAIRVISSLPDWKPGEQRGKKVNVAFTVPINFVLN